MKSTLLVGALALLNLTATQVRADPQIGDTLPSATIRDESNKPAGIPDFGDKVLLLMYTDPDEADQNDPFADQVKAAGLPKQYFRSIGIANMKDAPAKPDWAIRLVVKNKIRKYKVTILTDPDRLLIKQWNLGDCNNKSVVILIGKDKRLYYFKKGALSPAEQQTALAKIREVILKAATSSPPAPSTPPTP